MALSKKVYGVKIPISARIFGVHGVADCSGKAEKPLHPNQKLATSLDLS